MKRIPAAFLARWHAHEQMRFLLVGGFNTAFGYGSFAALYLLFGTRVHYLWIQVASHLLSVCNAFIWHRRLTFRSEGHWPREFLRFNLTYLGSLAFSLVTLPLLVSVAHLHPLVAAAIVTLVTVLLSYALHRSYSFRVRTPR